MCEYAPAVSIHLSYTAFSTYSVIPPLMKNIFRSCLKRIISKKLQCLSIHQRLLSATSTLLLRCVIYSIKDGSVNPKVSLTYIEYCHRVSEHKEAVRQKRLSSFAITPNIPTHASGRVRRIRVFISGLVETR